jgi:tight adherence protein C
MDVMTLLLIGLTFATLVCIALGTTRLARRRDSAVDRLERLVAGQSSTDAEEPHDDRVFRLASGAGRLLHRLGARLLGAGGAGFGRHARHAERLVQAGLRAPTAPAVFAAAKLLSLIAAGLLVGITAYVQFNRVVPAYGLGLAAALTGFIAPDLVVLHLARRRRQTIERELPDVLDLLVVCTQAGLGLDASIDRVAAATRRTCPTLAAELEAMVLEAQIGRPRHEVLRNLARRTGSESARSLAAILIQSDRFGTSVAQALSTSADSLRVARQHRAEAAAGRAAVKILFPLILCIFPAIFLVVAGPALIQLGQTLFPLLAAR